MIHFSFGLEVHFSRNPTWRQITQSILFQQGALAESGEKADSALGDGY
jgi:hypothetical protein